MNNLQNEIGQKVLNKVETKMNQLIPFSQINDMMNHQDEGQQNANLPGTFQEQQEHENQNQNQIQKVTNLNDNTNGIGNQQMIDYSNIQDGQYE